MRVAVVTPSELRRRGETTDNNSCTSGVDALRVSTLTSNALRTPRLLFDQRQDGSTKSNSSDDYSVMTAQSPAARLLRLGLGQVLDRTPKGFCGTLTQSLDRKPESLKLKSRQEPSWQVRLRLVLLAQGHSSLNGSCGGLIVRQGSSTHRLLIKSANDRCVIDQEIEASTTDWSDDSV